MVLGVGYRCSNVNVIYSNEWRMGVETGRDKF